MYDGWCQHPSYLPEAKVSGHVARNSQQLNIPLFKATAGQRSFQYSELSVCGPEKPR